MRFLNSVFSCGKNRDNARLNPFLINSTVSKPPLKKEFKLPRLHSQASVLTLWIIIATTYTICANSHSHMKDEFGEGDGQRE